MLSVRTSASGHGRPIGRTWDTSPQAIAHNLANHLAPAAKQQLLTNNNFWQILAVFGGLRPAEAVRGTLRRVVQGGGSATLRVKLIAQ